MPGREELRELKEMIRGFHRALGEIHTWPTETTSTTTTSTAASSPNCGSWSTFLTKAASRDRPAVLVSINRTRSALYSLARFFGDYQAVKRGRVGKRLARRAAGRFSGRGLGRLFR
jgi:hypothetical protein